MSTETCARNFERDALPHLKSAYNLARWLTRNDHDAEDIVQEAYLRAFRFYHSFRGDDARPWLLKIVRNSYYTWSMQNPAARQVDFDENLTSNNPDLQDSVSANPEEALLRKTSDQLLHKALETLPSRSREIIVLRELEGMSYNEISNVMGVPLGTVMSSLSRARGRLRDALTEITDGSADAQSDELIGASCS